MADLTGNYAAAFAMYTQGKTLVEIARVLGLDIDRLERRARDEQWPVLATSLRDMLPSVMPDDLDRSLPAIQSQKAQAHLARIHQNREQNMRIAEKLREDLLDIVTQLRTGQLKMKRHWCHKGLVTSKEVDLTMADRQALANYAQTIFGLTYQALGDKQLAGESKDALADAKSTPQITVILPGIVQRPREERNVTPPSAADGSKTIDGCIEETK